MASGETLEKIVTENEAPLLRYAWRYLQNESLAQDAVQESFVKYSQTIPGTIFNPRAWLYKTARNYCLNILRKQHRRPEIDLEHAEPVVAGSSSQPDAGLIHAENRTVLLRCLNRLKAKHKEAVILKLEHGKSYREIAEIMNLSVSNVGFILHAALKELKQNFSEEISK
ncbi:MAG: RNA polymerase sigma factor [Victivallaceae bacterium]